MAVQVTFLPGASTSNCSLPAWASDIASMPTTTVAGWEVLEGTTNGEMTAKSRATAYTARTFNSQVAVGSHRRAVTVVYNAVDGFCRT